MQWLGTGFVAVIVLGAVGWLVSGGTGSDRGGMDMQGNVSGAGPGTPTDLAKAAEDPSLRTGSVEWREPVIVASGEAYQGPWRMNESDFRYVDAPAADFRPDGSLALVWVEQSRRDVFYQPYGDDGRPLTSEPVNVSRSPNVFSWLPRVVAGPEGTDHVYVLWQEIVFSGGSHGGEIFFARSTDGGESFSDPVNLSNTPAGAGKGRLGRHLWHNGSLDLALGPDGSLYAAWTEYEGALRVARSSDRGESFSEPVTVVSREGPATRGPSLAVASDGTVHLAWTPGERPDADVLVARSDDGGSSFSEPRVAVESPGHADAPKLAAARDGTLHLAYGESEEGPGGAYQVRYTRFTGNFEEPRTLESPDPARGGGFPHLALDADDRPHLVWELFPNPGQRPMGLATAAGVDGGRDFEEPAPLPGSLDPELGINGSLQGLLTSKLAVREDGLVAVVNSTFNPGQESRVLLYLGEKRGR